MSPEPLLRTSTVALTLFFVLHCTSAMAALLDVELARLTGGGVRTVTIGYSAEGASAASIQFDLHFDAEKFALDTVEPGAVVTAAGKDLQYNQFEPGKVRVIIAGLNQNVIASGVVARLRVFSSPGAENTFSPISIHGALLSGPVGQIIQTNTLDGGLFIGTGVLVDVNGDGEENAVDVQIVINRLLGLSARCICDANGDTAVDAQDLQTVINGVLGVLPHSKTSARFPESSSV